MSGLPGVHVQRLLRVLRLDLVLLEEARAEGEDGDRAQRRRDEDGEHGQGQDVVTHLQPLRLVAELLEVRGVQSLHVVQEDGAQRGLHSGLGQPREGHEDLLLDVELAAHDGHVGADHPDDEGDEQNQDGHAQGLEVDLVHLDLGADEGEDDGLEDDPHPLEGLGAWVVVSPALAPPLDAGHEGHDDGGEPARAVVVDQVSSEQSDQAAAEKNQPPAMVQNM